MSDVHQHLGSREPDFLQASKAIYDQFEMPFGNTSIKLLGLADGYALLTQPRAYRFPELEELVLSVVRHKKTLLIDNVDFETLQWLGAFRRRSARMEIIEVRGMRASLLKPDAPLVDQPRVLAIFPHGFLRRRAVIQRAQEYMVVQAGQDTLPKQSIHMIGIGPSRVMLTRRAADLIVEAPLVVTFDYVHKVIADLPFRGRVVVLDYDWQSYTVNIERVNRELASLHVRGYYDVTVVIVGNPEVYDLLSFLSLAGRDYSFEPAAPAVTQCCAWITEHYSFDITQPSYVIVSGYNARLGVTSAQLAQELNAYLRHELTCLVIELYSGDLPLVLKRAQESVRPKVVIILINMFTPNQQIIAVSAKSMEAAEITRRVRGKFTSLAIVDEQRLQRNLQASSQFLRDFAPGPASTA